MRINEKVIFSLVSLFLGLVLAIVTMNTGWIYSWKLAATFLCWISGVYLYALNKNWVGDWKTGAMAMLWLLTLYGYAIIIEFVFDFFIHLFISTLNQSGFRDFDFNSESLFVFLSALQIIMLSRLIWKRALAVVEENRIWVVEFFGAYYASWEKGLHLIYPFGGVVKVVNIVPKEEKTISIVFKKNPEEKIEIAGDKVVFQTSNQVEFSNSSAPISIDFIVLFKDAYAATYKIDDVYFMLAKTVESALRSFFSKMSIDQANQIKSDYLVNVIFSESAIDYSNLDQYIGDTGYQASQTWLKIQSWGVEITRVVIADIDLPKKLTDVRERILIAEKMAEAAKKEGEAKVTMAEAGKKVLELEGKGRESQIESLVKSGLKPQEASTHMVLLKKWEAVSKKEGSVIIDSEGSSLPGIGAKLGIGFQSQNQGKDDSKDNTGNGGKQ